MQCDESVTIYRPCADKAVSRVPAKGTFGCLHRDAMPVSARRMEPAPILATVQSWNVGRFGLWRAAGYLSPLERSPGKLPEPCASADQASGSNAAMQNPRIETKPGHSRLPENEES